MGLTSLLGVIVSGVLVQLTYSNMSHLKFNILGPYMIFQGSIFNISYNLDKFELFGIGLREQSLVEVLM